MGELFHRLFIGHVHKYSIIRYVDRLSHGTVVGGSYDCRCEICGKIKTFKV